MGAARITSVLGVVTQAARARITSLSGVVGTTPKARITSLAGVVGGQPTARITSLAGVVGASPGAPTVTAGPDQSVPSGAVVRLSASAKVVAPAAPGTWSWVLVTKSANALAPDLSDPTAAAPTFYPQLRRRACSYTFGVTHTDSLGRTSPQATVDIAIAPAELLFPSEGGWNIPGNIAYAQPDGTWS